MRRKRFWIVALVLALALALVPMRHIAQAATVTVNSTTDVSDGDISSITNLIANPGPDGVISLREAIEAANNSPSSDTINFDTSAFPLASPATIAILSPLPSISSDTTIDGSTAGVILNGSSLSGYVDGLVIDGASNVVIKGLQILHFPGTGIELQNASSNNTIGGTNLGSSCSGDCNLISGNRSGVSIEGTGTMSNTVSGNYIGTDATGTMAISDGGPGVTISDGATQNVIGGDTAGERNLISGNGAGVIIEGSGTHHNTVSGNYIGTNINGTAAISNTYDGVAIRESAQYNVIGGDTAGERNLISGNSGEGVNIYDSGTMSNTVSGNYIGTDATGTMAIPNGHQGVDIRDGASYNVIGGDTAGERNLISGNGDNGVKINRTGTMSNTVSGNYIGTDASGTTAIPNRYQGVDIRDGASYNVIGGSNATPGGACTGECNLISSNASGVWIQGSTTNSNTVSGNYVGTDVTGSAPLGNQWDGIDIWDGQYNVIGGDTPAERNLVSANGFGVAAYNPTAAYNIIKGNYIGTDVSGTADLGNFSYGVMFRSGAHDNLAENNLIAYTRYYTDVRPGPGILVLHDTSVNNTLRQNSIHSNADKGILLREGGNTELAAPVITDFDLASGIVTGTACANCTVEVFSDSSDEGEVYEGQTTANGAGDFTFDKGASLTGPNVTATATDADGNTSEFSIVAPTQEAIALIIGEVEELVDTEMLNTGQGDSLIKKLENAIKKLNQGNTHAAINILEAFINQVNDFINEGVLSLEEGQPLIDTANSVIDSLSRGQ